MSSKLMDYFNKQPRLGTLSTASKDGEVNSAYFGSPYMVSEKTIIMGLTKNRTLLNLHDNPNAVFMIMEPGKTLSEWKGVGIYVKMTDCSTAGEKFDKMKAKIAAHAGDAARKEDSCGAHLRRAGDKAAGGFRAGMGKVDLIKPDGRNINGLPLAGMIEPAKKSATIR